jgi:ABC-type multidrug transport system ATPase subunit
MTVTAALPRPMPAARTISKHAAVRIDGVCKRFRMRRSIAEIARNPFQRKYQQALQDVTCEVMEGEFFGLLGPNGAGKTTLFKTLATLVIPDQGRASVLGFDVVRDARSVRKVLIPVVADERSLRWRVSARENLRLYAVLYGVEAAALKGRVEEVLEVVGLSDTGTKMVGQFSSGMKQRLLIARALLARPRILLLDEPTRGLDPLTARRLRNFLREEVCGRQGCTILLATHSAEEAFDLCDRVAILTRGQLLVAGAAEALMAQFGEERYCFWTKQPDDPAVAQLVLRGLAERTRAGRPDPEGWTPVEVKASGGHDGAARIVEFLTSRQVPLGRFERMGMSLAELIEKVQQAAEKSNA